MPDPATQSMSGPSYVAVVATEHMLVNYPAVASIGRTFLLILRSIFRLRKALQL